LDLRNYIHFNFDENFNFVKSISFCRFIGIICLGETYSREGDGHFESSASSQDIVVVKRHIHECDDTDN